VAARGLISLLPVLPAQLAIQPVVDWRVVVFALVVSVAAGLLAGLAPALQSTKPALAPELRSDVGGIGGRHRLRSALLVTQMAFSMLLLVVAALFGRALSRAHAIDPGFDPRGVQIATFDLRLANHTDSSGSQFFARLLEGAAAIPGADAVALSRMIPLDGGGLGLGGIEVPGRPRRTLNAAGTRTGTSSPRVLRRAADSAGIGRDFTERTAPVPPTWRSSTARSRRVSGR
jgi:hypothetical protein